jgi:IMP dehydrogenase
MEGQKIVSSTGLTFDDVLLLPGYTDFKRQDVNLTSKLHPKIALKLPIISSPMDTVTEVKMAIALGRAGGLGIIHRNLSITKQASIVKKVKAKKVLVGAAVGAGPDLENRVAELVKAGVDVIVVDSGHGHSKFIIDATAYIKKNYPQVVLMSGNVSTYEGAVALIRAGADILRVGMGPGSICTTRIIAGMGTPQVTAVMEAVRAAKNTKVSVVADGGIQQVGDIAKALACGAHAVMLGSLLARFDESPGKIVKVSGKKYKRYRGMGSVSAMEQGAAERYGQAKDSKKLIAEGVEGLVPYQGKVLDFLVQIEGSLRSSFYYIGAKTTTEFFKKSRFVKISNAGLKESHPHNILILESGANYLK